MALNIIQKPAKAFKRYGTPRSYKLDSIQVHSIGAGQNSIEPIFNNMNVYNPSGISHAIVAADKEDTVWQILPDNNVAWVDKGYGNNHSFAFEIAESDSMKYNASGTSFYVTNKANFLVDVTRGYNTAVKYTAYLCNKFKLNPMEKLSNGVYRVFSHNEGRLKGISSGHVDPTHMWLADGSIGKSMDDFRADVVRAMNGEDVKVEEPKYYRIGTGWVNGKCVGQIYAFESLENAKNNCPEGYKVFDNDGKMIYEVKDNGVLTARKLNGLTEAQKIAKIAPLYQQCQRDTGMLASVGLAQFCLESGYGTTDLAQNANNLHGMKCSLSGNTWSGSTWDGVSKYNKKTAEQDASGRQYYIYADFRKYPSCKESIYDRAAYFIGAIRTGTTKRYPNVNLITDAIEQVKLLKAGGYATDVNYVSKLTSIIKRFNLTQYDVTSQVDYKAIAKKYKQSKPVVPASDKPVSGVTYTVQAAACSSEDCAKDIKNQILGYGIDTIYKKERDGLYHVYCGTFSIKSNAINIVNKLANAGIKAILK
jgi:flagellum-specific peptidoglycan hydrolase FlgJ